MIKQKYIERLRVPSGEKIRLADYPTSVRDFKDIPEIEELDKSELKERAHEILRHNLT